MPTRRQFLTASLPLALAACSPREVIHTFERAVTSGSWQGAVQSVAQQKAQQWAANPNSLARDLKRGDQFLQGFLQDVIKVWGEDNSAQPSAKTHVKYRDHYETRSIIDFSKGLVRVETLDRPRLKDAIVFTLLSPQDPSSRAILTDAPIDLKGEPFLYQQVRDHDGAFIRWQWRAQRYADHLIKTSLTRQTIRNQSGQDRQGYAVEFPLVQQHQASRQNKFAPLVQRYAKQYRLDPALVYAIIETESSFNPYAVSWVPAYGLMQIVPKTAGRDAFKEIHGRSGTPSRDYLFNVDNNIRMGCAYLHILQTRYLSSVRDPLSRHYCVIAAYNGGAGNVLRSFHRSRHTAFQRINQKSPQAVYTQLRQNMPKESQAYLKKVTQAQKKYS